MPTVSLYRTNQEVLRAPAPLTAAFVVSEVLTVLLVGDISLGLVYTRADPAGAPRTKFEYLAGGVWYGAPVRNAAVTVVPGVGLATTVGPDLLDAQPHLSEGSPDTFRLAIPLVVPAHAEFVRFWFCEVGAPATPGVLAAFLASRIGP